MKTVNILFTLIVIFSALQSGAHQPTIIPEAPISLKALQCMIIVIGRDVRRIELPLEVYEPGGVFASDSNEPLSLNMKIEDKKNDFGALIYARKTDVGIMLTGTLVDGKNSLISYGHGFLSNVTGLSTMVTELRNEKDTVEAFQLDCSIK